MFCLLAYSLKVKTQKVMILSQFLYLCETWFLALKEEHRPRCLRVSSRVFENRVLRRVFEPKRDAIKGGWKNCIEFLATDPEVPGSIPGSTRFSEK
jgi:hypothetical protein